MKQFVVSTLFFFFFWLSACSYSNVEQEAKETAIRVGAERLEAYLPLLREKRVGLVVNNASRIGNQLLPDTLLSLGVDVRYLFVPEHGFRTTADAGAYIDDEYDKKTGLPIVSLYGKQREPSRALMDSIDVLVFDLQDVGVRFYTYLSSLHYCLRACAKSNTPLVLLDRPNPNIRKIDGPVLDTAFRSFVGLHPVPVVYGMTIGEYALMLVGEGWLETARQPDLQVIACTSYTRDDVYVLPYRPSPNLPTERSILLYPSLAFMEGTVFSLGRGTPHPFECLGAPGFAAGNFSFVPQPMQGARQPKHKGQMCIGLDLREEPLQVLRMEDSLRLEYLTTAYQHYQARDSFFLPNRFFDLLAGTDLLRKQLMRGLSANDIRASWQEGLQKFRAIRKKYLLYP